MFSSPLFYPYNLYCIGFKVMLIVYDILIILFWLISFGCKLIVCICFDRKKYIARQLCLKFWSVIQYKLMHQICYCFYCIIKKWSKISQKIGFLAHFERFFDYTLLHSDKLHTPIFCQIKHLMLWRGSDIILVNH